MAVVNVIQTFKSEHIRPYKSEFKHDFSKPVLMLLLDYHISHQCHNDSLLFNWSPTGVSDDSANLAEFKFEGHTCTQFCICTVLLRGS